MTEKVAVAMSGGVDSAGAALLLREMGFDVSGVTLLLHHFRDGAGDEVASAQDAARALGIPHEVLDLCGLFRQAVMDPFVAAYTAGRTPNPCIDCNRAVKFGALMEYVLSRGCRYLATGHYARIGRDGERYLLLRGRDRRKDQSYVLWQLTQEQLSHLLLPVGEYEKPAIRAMAAAHGFCSAGRRDSQDICFIPDGDYMRFLEEYGGVTPVPGDFVDQEGRVLGRHRGLERYTAGQRRGLGVSAERPLYVLSKDLSRGTVVLGPDEALYTRTLSASHVNLISLPELTGPVRVTAKTRYSQQEAAATAEPLPGGGMWVVFDEAQRAVTPGQSVVLYDGERVAGGGIIEASGT